jgi:glycosyltransferase involved in cell wall biosynthesis
MHIVAEMARAMRDVRFLAVQSDRGTSLPFHTANGETIPRTVDMRSVYGRTRILLMPSEMETWGRTAIEAAVSGIPTIAAPTAGLREALGDAGTFVDRDDIPGWCREVRRLLDPVHWEAMSTRAFLRAQVVESCRVAELDALARALECLTHVGQGGRVVTHG